MNKQYQWIPQSTAAHCGHQTSTPLLPSRLLIEEQADKDCHILDEATMSKSETKQMNTKPIWRKEKKLKMYFSNINKSIIK